MLINLCVTLVRSTRAVKSCGQQLSVPSTPFALISAVNSCGQLLFGGTRAVNSCGEVCASLAAMALPEHPEVKMKLLLSPCRAWACLWWLSNVLVACTPDAMELGSVDRLTAQREYELSRGRKSGTNSF